MPGTPLLPDAPGQRAKSAHRQRCHVKLQSRGCRPEAPPLQDGRSPWPGAAEWGEGSEFHKSHKHSPGLSLKLAGPVAAYDLEKRVYGRLPTTPSGLGQSGRKHEARERGGSSPTSLVGGWAHLSLSVPASPSPGGRPRHRGLPLGCPSRLPVLGPNALAHLCCLSSGPSTLSPPTPNPARRGCPPSSLQPPKLSLPFSNVLCHVRVSEGPHPAPV